MQNRLLRSLYSRIATLTRIISWVHGGPVRGPVTDGKHSLCVSSSLNFHFTYLVNYINALTGAKTL